MQFITMSFRRERPARWAVHVVKNLMQDMPQGSLSSVWRDRLKIQAAVQNELVQRIDVRTGDSLFHRLCFAYALRYPHVPFTMSVYFKEERTGYTESTEAIYENGTVHVAQTTIDANDCFQGKYAFVSHTHWQAAEGTFKLVKTDFPDISSINKEIP